MKLTRSAVLLLVALSLAASVPASAQIFGLSGFDPVLKWQTLETEHFRIHFHQGLEGVAQEAALIAEEYYKIIKEEFGGAPAKLDLFFVDAFDFPNGFAIPHMDHVGILTSQYRLSDFFNVRLDSWWRMVIFHELVHAIELDQTRGISRILRTIFGKTILPDTLKPIPFIEGLAVYEKYKHLKESRLNDSRTRMMLRQMVLDNLIPRFEEIKGSYTRSEWPSIGLLWYNYGSWLMRYIEEAYGADAMRRFDEENAKRPLNLLAFLSFGDNLDAVVRQTLKVSADELYQGFRTWLRTQFTNEMEKIRDEGVTEAIRVTNLGFWTGEPAWSPDGKWLAYTYGGPGRAGLRLITPEGEEDHEIVPGSISLPSWSPDSKALIYAKLDFSGPYYIKSDLYRYDLEKEKEERLTWGERAYYGRFSPDGTKVYYAKNVGRDGSTALATLDLKTHKSSTVREFPENTGIIHSFAISPDGKQIALTIWRPGGYQDLYLIAAEGEELNPITQDKNQEADPVWSPDGKFILFSSDPDRIYNLYAYRVEDGKFFKVTNMLAGAFYPTISPEGKEIAFIGYSSQGYDIYRLPYEPQSWKPVEFPKEAIPAWTGYPTTKYPIRPYDPLPLMVPKLWLPIPWPGGAGVATFSFDPLFKHFYGLIAGWNFEKNRPFYEFSYVLNEFTPISFSASADPSGSSQGVEGLVPLSLSFARQQLLSLGYKRAERPPQQETQDGSSTKPSITHTISGTYSFRSTRQQDLFQDLLQVSVGVELKNIEGSKVWRKKLILDWREDFRLPLIESHWLRLKLIAGWTDADEDEEKFKLGGPYGRFVLRGFGSEAFKGKQAISASLQYDFTLFSVERGLGHWPIFFDDLSLSLFVDVGMAADQLKLQELKLGFGAELGLSLTLGYYQSLMLIAGVAQGLGEREPLFYLNASLPGLF